MRVIGFGTYDRSVHPRAGILLDGFRAHGDDVEEINEPLGFTTADRVRMLESPTRALALAGRLALRWASLTRRALAARTEHAQRPDAVLVGYLGHFDVFLARILHPRTMVALDMLIFAADTARDRGVAPGAKTRILGGLDRAAAAVSSIVVVDTEDNVSLLPERLRHKAVVVEVGSPADWFRPPRSDDDWPGPEQPLKVIFFGLFTPLQGACVIAEALTLLPHDTADVVMVGTGQDHDEAQRITEGVPGVSWVDWLGPDELRQIVWGSDVCLGIFGDTPKGRRVTPNKVFQGAAAGCAIVTSDTTPQRRSLGDAALFVPAGDPVHLAEALTRLAGDREELDRLRHTARARAVARYRPEVVVVPLRDAIRTRLEEGMP